MLPRQVIGMSIDMLKPGSYLVFLLIHPVTTAAKSVMFMSPLSKAHTHRDTKEADGSASALALLLCQVFISAVTACAYPADTLAK